MKNTPVGVTIGDPAGIGPEITAKLLLDESFRREYPFVPVGSKFVLEDAFKNILREIPPKYKCISDPDQKPFDIVYGQNSSVYGGAAMKAVKTAVGLIQKGKIQAMTTAPINKYSAALAGYKYMGHTEYLGKLTGTSDFSMMLASPTLRVIPVTVHIPLKDVAATLTCDSILKAIQNAHNSGRFWGLKCPRIAVCALNPHAGEKGSMGIEEQTLIIPAIMDALNTGIDVTGPHPADSLFARTEIFDIAVCMYHDQGLIPVKMTGFGSTVNITLNLPIIRTSVDHGTAFNIAGKGVANPESLRQAIIMAHKIAVYRV